jgi:hypothetical protein
MGQHGSVTELNLKEGSILKMRIASLSLLALCLTLAALPAMADNLYDNGPINGNTDAWTINFGFAVSDTFTLGAASTVNGVSFGAWLAPGDTLTSAEVSITSAELGGTTYFDGTVNFSSSGCSTNTFGYNVCTETGSFAGVNLASGTYWLNLQNASVPSGDPVYWDENSGPSQASENTLGTIPSEAFTVLGSGGTSTTGTTTTGGTTPEPSSIMLFGSGILGLAGVLRRKLF